MTSSSKKIYEAQVAYRGTSRGLLIPDEHRYRRRLEIAAELLKETDFHAPANQGSWVLDLGCGYADFANVAKLNPSDYVGIEQVDWICQEARKRHPHHSIHNGTVGEKFSFAIHPNASTPRVVLALGLLATVPRSEQKDFIRILLSYGQKWLIMSWLNVCQYRGTLEAADFYDVVIACGSAPVAYHQSAVDAQTTALFKCSC